MTVDREVTAHSASIGKQEDWLNISLTCLLCFVVLQLEPCDSQWEVTVINQDVFSILNEWSLVKMTHLWGRQLQRSLFTKCCSMISMMSCSLSSASRSSFFMLSVVSDCPGSGALLIKAQRGMQHAVCWCCCDTTFASTPLQQCGNSLGLQRPVMHYGLGQLVKVPESSLSSSVQVWSL